MSDYIVRLYDVIEVKMRAESLEQAIELCDLNTAPQLTGVIVEIDNVIEGEEV
ncbi:hypothetical protein [Rodentibacter trehalosifermentans]|uniref:hypothetical protein n=1 Tax=Rodentibacter trehalosifermentans TaxID=1908263 RepID=UPI001428C4BA|nr:hypothetical protein [Rodentibacter trehalosifermentans]